MKPRANGPLGGIRIADFTVHNAGPFCTHMLSQLDRAARDRLEASEVIY